MPEDEINKKTKEMMDMVGLDMSYLDRYPTELSGGQQQRVGVARAFLTDPSIILMDEPFSALDPMTRNSLQDELLRIEEKFKKTIVFVTHDMDEAIKIADKICIMDGGHIIQYDTPENILKHPKNKFVSDFVGPKRIWTSPEFIKVKDIMLKSPVTCRENLSLFRCLTKMRNLKVDTLMVVDSKKKYLGSIIIDELSPSSDLKKNASNYISKNSISVKETDSLIDVLNVVNNAKTTTIPVVNSKGILQGLITRGSLLTSLSSQFLEGSDE